MSVDKVALFAKDCIFCNKEGNISIRKAGVKTTEITQKFASDGWKTIVQCAKSKNDEKLLLRIRGYDLFASEAHFHPKCRKKYVQDPQYGEAKILKQNFIKRRKRQLTKLLF